jgi:chloride channel 3/4/5
MLHYTIAPLLSEDLRSGTLRRLIFSTRSSTYSSDMGQVNLAGTLDESVLQLRKEVPQELVVSLFQKMVCNIA